MHKIYGIIFIPITYKSMFGKYLCKLHVNIYAVIGFKDHRIEWKNTVECKYSRLKTLGYLII